MAAHATAAAQFLRALANPHRLRVLCELAGQELSVSDLNARIELSQPALSQHLKVLREDGLVITRREAQTIFYQLTPGPALEVIQVLHRHFCAEET
jgi:DNA-binding transcriptional ArsR family regulator